MQDGDLDDEALVKRAGRGDKAAGRVLVMRHTEKIYGLCFRMIGDRHRAEDAAQETFLRLWKNARRWKPGKARLQTWLYKVATNICIDELKRAARLAPQEAAPEQIDRGPLPDESMLEKQRRVAIDAALARLPVRQKLALTLCHFEELSNFEAAEIMGVSVEALESLLARGRRVLRAELAPLKQIMTGTLNDDALSPVH